MCSIVKITELRGITLFITNKVGTQDGQVYNGAVDDTGTLMRVGDDGNGPDREYISFLGVPLDSIPSGVTITSATLFFYYQNDNSDKLDNRVVA